MNDIFRTKTKKGGGGILYNVGERKKLLIEKIQTKYLIWKKVILISKENKLFVFTGRKERSRTIGI
jgi:hypothetical protein